MWLRALGIGNLLLVPAIWLFAAITSSNSQIHSRYFVQLVRKDILEEAQLSELHHHATLAEIMNGRPLMVSLLALACNGILLLVIANRLSRVSAGSESRGVGSKHTSP